MTYFLKCSRILLLIVSVASFRRTSAMLAAPQSQAGKAPQSAPSKPTPPGSSQEIQTEKVEAPALATVKPSTVVSQAGSMPAAEVQATLQKIRFSEIRINDLLTDVHPDRWKLQTATLDSLNQSLKTLRDQVTALEGWRAQLNARPDSIYLGFQTYTAIDAVLPRLYGVARSVSEHENASYGAQFNQAGDQLFSLQQTIGTFVSSLLQSQDQVIAALGNNLAGCQKDLTVAMRSAPKPVKYMKNFSPIRPQRRSSRRASSRTGTRRNKKKPSGKSLPK